MGIITKEVEVRPNGKMIQYYKDKGYDARNLVPLLVRVEDLPINSSVKINVVCDVCGKIKDLSYATYMRGVNNGGYYCCSSKCGRDKVLKTVRERYSCNNPMQNIEIKNRQIESLKSHYGVESPLKNKEILKRAQTTIYEKYNVLSVSQNEEIKEKMASTMVDRYGVPYTFQSQELMEKRRKTWVQNWGTDNPNKNSKVREKITQTLYKNESQKVSKQQRYICNLYQGVLNFPVKYYNCDIYLSEDNLIVEYDGGFHMGNVITGRETKEEHNQKEIIRNNVIKHEGYKQMKIVSSKDYLPSDQILLQMLSHTKEYFSEHPERSWVQFNVDTSTVRNAEHGEVFFDFGQLRRIKKSDLPDKTTILETA